MPKYRLSQEELEEQLIHHCRFLRSSCKSFDDGIEEEAQRLALGIRLLLHDTKSSRSLLKQLGKKDQMLFYRSTAPYFPDNPVSFDGLTIQTITFSMNGGSAKIMPALDSTGRMTKDRKLPFEYWWNELILKDNLRSLFSRKKLILEVVNKDGGAHVDGELSEQYASLKNSNSLGFGAVVLSKKQSLNNPVFPTVRQIAHEVIRSIEDEFPDLQV